MFPPNVWFGPVKDDGEALGSNKTGSCLMSRTTVHYSGNVNV
jgi:hypothetical protein